MKLPGIMRRAAGTPVFLQSEASECGMACVAMIAAHHGARVDLAGMRQRFGPSMRGSTLKELMESSAALGLSSRAVRVELAGLGQLKLPCILHWNLNHFVVLTKVRRAGISVHDPARGRVHLSLAEASAQFTGVALELTRNHEPVGHAASAPVRIRDLIGTAPGAGQCAIQLLLLSLFLQGFLLLTPVYLQLAIDEAIANSDLDFLAVLAIGFGVLYLFVVVTEALRFWVSAILGHLLAFRITENVVRHLLRLPLAFFEKRYSADILSRVASCRQIQRTISQGAIEALIDGVMLLSVAAVLLAYQVQLGLVITITAAGCGAVLVLLQVPRRARQAEEVKAQAEEQSRVMESVQGISTIRLFGLEAQREAAWSNTLARSINLGLQGKRLEAGQGLARNLFFSAQLVLVVFLGATMVIDGTLTVGTLLAVLALRQVFADRTLALFSWWVDWKLVEVHVERLADIVLAERDPFSGTGGQARQRIVGELALEQVGFRYAANERPLLSGIDLRIRAGEFVVIKGRSGCGKSTLFKLLLGLYRPTEGRVLVDGESIESLGPANFHAAIGVVQQDDRSFVGTIADNIAMFDPALDMERVIAAARLACVHDDIQAMPMKYLSLIGELGSALSGGQKQRVLLARALYRQPSMLFLDEGTANLDEDTEAAIADTIAGLAVTRVVIAHRDSFFRRADRAFILSGGQLQEVDPQAQGAPASRSFPDGQ